MADYSRSHSRCVGEGILDRFLGFRSSFDISSLSFKSEKAASFLAFVGVPAIETCCDRYNEDLRHSLGDDEPSIYQHITKVADMQSTTYWPSGIHIRELPSAEAI